MAATSTPSFKQPLATPPPSVDCMLSLLPCIRYVFSPPSDKMNSINESSPPPVISTTIIDHRHHLRYDGTRVLSTIAPRTSSPPKYTDTKHHPNPPTTVHPPPPFIPRRYICSPSLRKQHVISSIVALSFLLLIVSPMMVMCLTTLAYHTSFYGSFSFYFYPSLL